jgi:hypothetical protein
MRQRREGSRKTLNILKKSFGKSAGTKFSRRRRTASDLDGGRIGALEAARVR